MDLHQEPGSSTSCEAGVVQENNTNNEASKEAQLRLQVSPVVKKDPAEHPMATETMEASMETSIPTTNSLPAQESTEADDPSIMQNANPKFIENPAPIGDSVPMEGINTSQKTIMSTEKSPAKDYSCSQCDLTFSEHWRLNIHKRTHRYEEDSSEDQIASLEGQVNAQDSQFNSPVANLTKNESTPSSTAKAERKGSGRLKKEPGAFKRFRVAVQKLFMIRGNRAICKCKMVNDYPRKICHTSMNSLTHTLKRHLSRHHPHIFDQLTQKFEQEKRRDGNDSNDHIGDDVSNYQSILDEFSGDQPENDSTMRPQHSTTQMNLRRNSLSWKQPSFVEWDQVDDLEQEEYGQDNGDTASSINDYRLANFSRGWAAQDPHQSHNSNQDPNNTSFHLQDPQNNKSLALIDNGTGERSTSTASTSSSKASRTSENNHNNGVTTAPPPDYQTAMKGSSKPHRDVPPVSANYLRKHRDVPPVSANYMRKMHRDAAGTNFMGAKNKVKLHLALKNNDNNVVTKKLSLLPHNVRPQLIAQSKTPRQAEDFILSMIVDRDVPWDFFDNDHWKAYMGCELGQLGVGFSSDAIEKLVESRSREREKSIVASLRGKSVFLKIDRLVRDSDEYTALHARYVDCDVIRTVTLGVIRHKDDDMTSSTWLKDEIEKVLARFGCNRILRAVGDDLASLRYHRSPCLASLLHEAIMGALREMCEMASGELAPVYRTCQILWDQCLPIVDGILTDQKLSQDAMIAVQALKDTLGPCLDATNAVRDHQLSPGQFFYRWKRLEFELSQLHYSQLAMKILRRMQVAQTRQIFDDADSGAFLLAAIFVDPKSRDLLSVEEQSRGRWSFVEFASDLHHNEAFMTSLSSGMTSKGAATDPFEESLNRKARERVEQEKEKTLSREEFRQKLLDEIKYLDTQDRNVRIVDDIIQFPQIMRHSCIMTSAFPTTSAGTKRLQTVVDLIEKRKNSPEEIDKLLKSGLVLLKTNGFR